MREEIVKRVYAALDEANEDRQDLPPLAKSLDTEIQANPAPLDSLALINFLVGIEEGIEEELDVPITLSDDRVLAAEPSPLQSVGTLVQYIETLLREQSV